jgi:hypothetical protein
MIVTEKDAISGAIMPVCSEWQIPLAVLRGYASESVAWRIARDVTKVQVTGRTVCTADCGTAA